jgi:hypothetical protein
MPSKRLPIPGRNRANPWWRWAVVVVGVAVLCCLPVLASAIPASVPPVTAAQLKDRILTSQDQSFAGYAESDAAFDLPDFPAFSTVTPLLDGITRIRVWQQNPDHWRVDTLSDTGEDDTYQAGDDEYVWDSGAELLTGIYGSQSVRLPRAGDLVPPALAIRILDEAGPDARLRLLAPRRVAGQSVAGIAVTPASAASTIGQADIWANPGTGLPMLVEIFGRGTTTPALTTQFLQAGSWKPDPAILTPERGPATGFTATTPGDFAGVVQNLGDAPLPDLLDGFPHEPSPVGYGQIGVYGSGLATFAVLPFDPDTGGQLLADALDAGATPVTVDNGTGAMASAPLVNLVLLQPYRISDTFLLVGLVSKTVLTQAAQELALGS